jgi:hypothetical protein
MPKEVCAMTIRRAATAFGLLATASLIAGGGCTTMAKQALHEVRGAKADVSFVQDVAEHALAKYQSVRFERASSDVGQVCPPTLLQAWDLHAAEEQTRLAKYFPGGAPTLRVESEIFFFKEKGLFGYAECLARVRMRENDTVMADLIVQALSKSFRAGDENALAEAAIQRIARFLKEQKKVEGDEDEDAEDSAG